MDFPLTGLLDEQACSDFLIAALSPDGLRCPNRGRDDVATHRAHRAPVYDSRGPCGRVFNAWTGTALQGTRRTPAGVVLLARGIAQGVPTARLARERGCSRRHPLGVRHALQHAAFVRAPPGRLPDAEVEADAMFQNAGEKRHAAPRPRRPAAAAGR